MKFLVTVYGNSMSGMLGPNADGHTAFIATVAAFGELVDGGLLADPSTSVLVSIGARGTTVTDGPCPDLPVQAAAYYLLDCQDHERAVQLAAMHPAAGYRAVEVRPVMQSSGLEM